MKSDRVYLLHILDTIERVQRYTSAGEAAFREDTMMQDAVLRNLQTMAESSQRLSEAVKAANPDVRWRAIAGFRNVVVHDYLGIDLAEVWAIVQQHLPEFRSRIETILGSAQRDRSEEG